MTNLTERNNKLFASLSKNNEVKIFDELFNKYSDKLFRFSFSLLKNEEDSKEIVQETFCKIWDKREEIDKSRSIESFIFTISYHLIIDKLRLRLKDQKYRKFLKQYFSQNSSQQIIHMDYDTLRKKIDIAVEELPAKRKHIYLLSREKKLSHKEISVLLNIKTKTVENQINLALRHIKFRLGKDFIPALLFLSLFG